MNIELPENNTTIIELNVRLMSRSSIDTSNEKLWQEMLTHREALVSLYTLFNLELFIDETEGVALLRGRRNEGGEGNELPSLVKRQPISFGQSYLYVHLRKFVYDHESLLRGDEKVIITEEEIIDLMSGFFKTLNDDVKQKREQGTSLINRAIKDGFLKERKKTEDNVTRFIITKLIKARVGADQLKEILENYQDCIANKISQKLENKNRRNAHKNPIDAEGADEASAGVTNIPSNTAWIETEKQRLSQGE